MNHYETLGVPPDAPAGVIKAAYRRLAREHHPDREGGSAERMQAINEAWRVLSDRELRAHYDATGRSGRAQEEPREVREAKALVLSLFRQCVVQAFAAGKDPLEIILRDFDGRDRLTARATSESARNIRVLQGKMARLKRRGGVGENLLIMAVQGMIAEHELALNAAKEVQATLKAARDLVAEYRYEAGPDDSQAAGPWSAWAGEPAALLSAAEMNERNRKYWEGR